MAKAAPSIASARMSLEEAVTLAGSFESLLPHLLTRPPRILAWHNGSYSLGVFVAQAGIISPKAWAQVRDVDVKAGRVYVRNDLLFIGVELERVAAEARLPAQPKPPAPVFRGLFFAIRM